MSTVFLRTRVCFQPWKQKQTSSATDLRSTFFATDAHRWLAPCREVRRIRVSAGLCTLSPACLPAGRQACPAVQACRGVLRSGPAFQASLSAGPSSPTGDRLVQVARSPSKEIRLVLICQHQQTLERETEQAARGQARDTDQACLGRWLCRSTPLQAAGMQGRRSLGQTCDPSTGRPVGGLSACIGVNLWQENPLPAETSAHD